ncbi:hypothetical protein HDU98_001347, partial [Podochytrium sp. JEL0797]
MAATKDTVLEHLRALGYLDTSLHSLVSESFLLNCIDELNDDETRNTSHHSDNLDLSYRFDLDEIERSLYREDNLVVDDSSRFMRDYGDASIEVEHEDSVSPYVPSSLSNRLYYEHQQRVEDEDSYFNYSLDNTRDCLASSKREERMSQFTNSKASKSNASFTSKQDAPESPLSVIQRLASLDLSSMQSRVVSQQRQKQTSATKPTPTAAHQHSNENRHETLGGRPAPATKEKLPAKYTAAKHKSLPVELDYVDDDSSSIFSTRSSHRPPTRGNGFIRTAPPVTLKKSDPVAKFHAHQQ